MKFLIEKKSVLIERHIVHAPNKKECKKALDKGWKIKKEIK